VLRLDIVVFAKTAESPEVNIRRAFRPPSDVVATALVIGIFKKARIRGGRELYMSLPLYKDLNPIGYELDGV